MKRDIALKLTVVSRQMQTYFAKSVAEIGVTRSQWGVIVVVARKPGLSQRTVAEALDMTEAAAGRLIDRLCTDGYLERRPREDDRRAYQVWLTEKAKPLLETLDAIARSSEVIAFDGLTDADLGDLSKLLNRIYANIGPSRTTQQS
jgi:MarR family transcriptional regulator, transcriptional regulator for hemolysin